MRWVCCAMMFFPAWAMAQEQVAFAPLPGFELGFENGTSDQFIREYVPRGQSVENWTELQTHQRFPNWAGGNPIEFLRLLAGDLQVACPDVGFRVQNGRVAGGYPNAAIFGRCPEGPEWFVIVAISGDAALHVVQHAWRGAPPAQAAFTARLDALTALPLCQAAQSPEACP